MDFDLSDPKQQINLFYMIAIAPLLGYIGYMGVQGEKIDQKFFYLLCVIALVVFMYHCYRLNKVV